MDDETILDALSAIRLAHQYSTCVYLLGHSLGAMLAPLIAERAAEPLEGLIMLQPQGQTDAARRLTLPMLILQGERDYQVTMQDFHRWQQVLDGKSKIVFRSYPRLNHPFMEGVGKSTPMEYQMEGHVATYVMDDISSFIHQQNMAEWQNVKILAMKRRFFLSFCHKTYNILHKVSVVCGLQ